MILLYIINFVHVLTALVDNKKWTPIALMVVFNWWMAVAKRKEELNCAVKDFGQPSELIATGTTMIPEWCVGKWDTLINVRMLKHAWCFVSMLLLII